MILYLIVLVIVGLITGALARLALPGRDPMSIPATIGVGLAGSLIAGLIYYAISGGDARGGGWFLSFCCSVAADAATGTDSRRAASASSATPAVNRLLRPFAPVTSAITRGRAKRFAPRARRA